VLTAALSSECGSFAERSSLVGSWAARPCVRHQVRCAGPSDPAIERGDVQSWSVRELRSFLDQRGVRHADCCEKRELVERVCSEQSKQQSSPSAENSSSSTFTAAQLSELSARQLKALLEEQGAGGESRRLHLQRGMRLAGQAAGMEGWRAQELKALPLPLLDRLAVLFNVIEESGRWPESLERALFSLIPKGDGASPTDMRPISVMSAVYRLWAASRLVDVKLWQEQWVSSSQHGFRAQHGPDDVFWTVALRVEESVLSGVPLSGVSFDYMKCSDLIPHNILMNIMDELGLSPRISTPLRTMYRRLSRRYSTRSPCSSRDLQKVVAVIEEFSIWSGQVLSDKSCSFHAAEICHDKVELACKIAHRIQWAPLPFDARVALTSALVLPRCCFGSSVTPLANNQCNKLRQAALRAVWGHKRQRRCQEVVFTLLAPGHRLDPRQACQNSALATMRSMLRRRQDLHSSFRNTWIHVASSTSASGGSVASIASAARQLGWTWKSPFVFTAALEDDVEPLKMNEGEWGHLARAGIRLAAWRPAARRRQDMRGIENGIDRDATLARLRSSRTSPFQEGVLRSILAGAIIIIYGGGAPCGMTLDRSTVCSGTKWLLRGQLAWQPAALCPPAPTRYFLLSVTLWILTAPDMPDIFEAEPEHWVEGRVVVFTDGASRDNEHHTLRRAGVGAFWGKNHALNVAEPLPGESQTNNRAELAAVIRAIQCDPRPLDSRTDSMYVFRGCAVSLEQWRLTGWRSGGREICNPDLWQCLYDLLVGLPPGHVLFRKVKAHSSWQDVLAGKTTEFDRYGNDGADALAVSGAALHAAPLAQRHVARQRLLLAQRVQSMTLEIAEARSARRRAGLAFGHLSDYFEASAQGGRAKGCHLFVHCDAHWVGAAEDCDRLACRSLVPGGLLARLAEGGGNLTAATQPTAAAILSAFSGDKLAQQEESQTSVQTVQLDQDSDGEEGQLAKSSSAHTGGLHMAEPFFSAAWTVVAWPPECFKPPSLQPLDHPLLSRREAKSRVRQAAEENGLSVWRVVHKPRVGVRSGPSGQAPVVDVFYTGDELAIVPAESQGAWLRLAKASWTNSADAPEEAWVLSDGASVGLGPLLELVYAADT
ncbi:unnamed protein product, partial [Polarella glacialis]